MRVRCVRILEGFRRGGRELDVHPNDLIAIGDEFDVKAISATAHDPSLGIELRNGRGALCTVDMFEVIDGGVPSNWEAMIPHRGKLILQPEGWETRITRDGTAQRLWD